MSEFAGMQAQGWPVNLFCWKATIPADAAVSEMIPTQGKALVGILMPAEWTAAAIGFKTCLNGNPDSLVSVFSSAGTAMTTAALPASQSVYVPFPALDAVFGPFIQLASVTANTDTGVNQAAERVIYVLFRNYLD